MPIDRRQSADIHAQPARDAGADGLDAELFALDRAGLDHVLGQCRKAGVVAQSHAKIRQAAEQQALGTADLGQ
ncbi:MAG: hypothetical protein AW08_03562 [Candidatus Accumulibacter adjunctus]|uniref:Uncharacterized protein n=1 Tax=Candidatus Accumulibacter adjunctus TaxID=1454001 RepID=A0A011NKV9_9PROT|nr:MAG: hypothetical protein AW08_03562 [Candidatus Accumulibacter adjunctus]